MDRTDGIIAIEQMGTRLVEMFAERGNTFSKDERYSLLKLAELCIVISKKIGDSERRA